jgi:hypothetical protein
LAMLCKLVKFINQKVIVRKSNTVNKITKNRPFTDSPVIIEISL